MINEPVPDLYTSKDCWFAYQIWYYKFFDRLCRATEITQNLDEPITQNLYEVLTTEEATTLCKKLMEAKKQVLMRYQSTTSNSEADSEALQTD
jgi:hypothetical protein